MSLRLIALSRSGWWRGAPAWSLAIIAAIVFLALANRGGNLTVRFNLESEVSGGQVVVYFDDGSGYREDATVRAMIRKGAHRYQFRLPTSPIKEFRIDPATHDRVTRIGAVEALSGSTVLKRFDAAALLPVNDIESLKVESGGRALRFAVRPGASDPYFVVSGSSLTAGDSQGPPMGAIVFSVLLVALALRLIGNLRRDGEGDAGVSGLAFGVVIGLAMSMALFVTTEQSSSPDQQNHLDAARYYVERWMPPAVGDPASLSSYSVYGFSYLNEPDVVYLIAAKLVGATSFTGLEDTIRFRLFNVLLLVMCAVLALGSQVARAVTLPVLCTPQAWYVFSYFNADAFALFVTLLLGVATARYLQSSSESRDSRTPADLGAALTIGILVALSVLSKKTFYPFLVFLPLYVLWRSGFRKPGHFAPGLAGFFLLAFWAYAGQPYESAAALVASPALRHTVLVVACALIAASAWNIWGERGASLRSPATLWLAVAVAGVLVSTRILADVAVNGWPWEKAGALATLAERIAGPNFRPSVIGTEAGYPSAALATKGIGLAEMLFGRFGWVALASASFFGVYGYMDILAPPWTYQVQGGLALAVLAAVVVRCAKREAGMGVVALGLACIGLALSLAVLHSWVRDFQPQGRYLFVILPIFGLLMLEAERAGATTGQRGVERRITQWAVAALWMLGVASFSFLGLPWLLRA